MIIGIGVDVVDIDRFQTVSMRTAAFAERVFTDHERFQRGGAPRSIASMAARFAAKEAVAKALGVPAGLSWHEVEVSRDDGGRPRLALSGQAADTAAARGITDWHISLTHDAGVAIAYVIAERQP
ncbi:MAG: holo-ACP synthase [Candidatus Nanopelagicales bacterium]